MTSLRLYLATGTAILGIALIPDGFQVFGRPFNAGAILFGLVLFVVGALLSWRWRRDEF